MLVTDWLRQFQNRLAFHRRFGRSLKRRRSRRIHSAVESLEVRTLLDGITFSVSGPSTVTEDVSDGDNNEAVYTISYTGTPEIGETVSVNVARLLDDTDSSDFTSDLATSITTAAAGANNVTFDGMTLSFENVSSNASVTASSFVGTVSQGTNGDDAWTSLSSAVGDTPSTFAYVNAHRNDTTNSLRLTDFNLDIPNSATVEGIEVTLLTTGSDNPDNGLGIRLTKNGITAVGTPASSTGSWETGNISIGGAADLWSTTWTAAEVNSANFGMIIDLVGDNNGDQYRVYTAQVSVSYSVAGGAPTSLDFTLGVTADSPSESDESYRIQLTSAGRTGAGTATIDASTVSTTIVNDPAAGNQIPTVSLSNTVTALSESTDTTSRILVADITVVDDAFGTNVLGLSGPNATLFEIENGQLFLKAGTTFDANLLPQIDVSVVVDDNTVGGSPDSTAPLTISVLASLNANDDTATTEMDESVLVDVLANDTGVDVSIASFTQPVNGTVTQVSGQLQYEPDTGFIGIDSFNYTVEDGQGELATAEAVVTVTPVSLTEAVSDSLTFNHTGNGVELDVLANDIGNGLRIVEVTQPLAALITIDPGGDQLVFTPVLTSQTGTVTFDYTIEDDVQVRSTAQVTLNVNGGEGGNFHPVGGDDTATTEMDSPVVIDVLANDTDSTQDPLSLISLTDP
ncbi:MAG: cadherin-like domain-containing protein, partial [Planctomycetaceae bacterium]|nr:cadherin-like domain-containing protein [Planctomycetaceae bacterium]